MNQLPKGIIFGCHPRSTVCGVDGLFPKSSVEPLPRDQFAPWDLSAAINHVYRQAGGTCVAHGTCTAAMVVRQLNGQAYHLLNPYLLYGLGSQNINSGLPIEAGLDLLRRYGTVDTDFWPTLGDINQWHFPEGWELAAAKYKAIEWDDLDGDFDLIWTLGQRGFPSVIGTAAVGGAHCMCVVGGEYVGRELALVCAQSWGDDSTNYGRPGYWRFLERELRDMPRFGAWALRSVTVTDPPTERTAA